MVSDSDLKQRVIDELRWEPAVDSAHIGVIATDGAIVLNGYAGTFHQRFRAIEATRRVDGVRAIADEIDVRLTREHVRDDAEIATHIAHVLECNISLPHSNVQAQVEAGFVTLSGKVDWHHQRQHILEQVGQIAGIKEIANEIMLIEQPVAGDVEKNIQDAIYRNTFKDKDSIAASVSDHTVTLSGEVPSLYERDLAHSAAWSAAGVRQVVDRIRIV